MCDVTNDAWVKDLFKVQFQPVDFNVRVRKGHCYGFIFHTATILSETTSAGFVRLKRNFNHFQKDLH